MRTQEPKAREANTDRSPQLRQIALRQPYIFALFVLFVAVVVNYVLQPYFFQPAILSGNLRIYLPLMLIAAGQTIVVVGGGIDLSLGAIVSLVNVVMVRAMGDSASTSQVLLALAIGLTVGVLAGAFNGLCASYLRFQPIVTTFATSFVFSGLAIWVLPSPGGSVPSGLTIAYASSPLGIPLFFYVVALVLLLWGALRSTRYGRYLYAAGGRPLSAYVSGVPVPFVKFSTYCIAGLMAAFAALALVFSTGTGDPLIGGPMTLSSIVAVVLGGTRLSGGQGGVAGSLIGVVILGLIQSIISYANVPSLWQTLINGLIVIVALAGPGLFALLRKRRS